VAEGRGAPARGAVTEPRPTVAAPLPANDAGSNGTRANGIGPRPVASGEGGLDVERLVDLWPRVRQDVKAVNRRIEALLSSVDPAAVDGERITLAAAYEFHRDKLNTDEVRAVVEEAIARLVGRTVQVQCLLRGEVSALIDNRAVTDVPVTVTVVAGAADRPSPEPNLSPDQGPVALDDAGALSDLEADEQRIRAAKNIFDAEEIEVPPRRG
jgi:hypothetical protein